MGRLTTSDTDRYINETFCQESSWMLEAKNKAIAIGREPISISPYEGKILKTLAKLRGCRSALELGTLTGYSAFWIAEGLGGTNMSSSMTMSTPTLTTIEMDPELAKWTKNLFERWNLENKTQISVICGDAEVEMSKLAQTFDFIFIDANKSRYLEYLQLAEARLEKGGLLVADNTLLDGELISNIPSTFSKKQIEVVREFNRQMADPSKYQSVMIPTFSGLSVGIKL